MTRGSGSWSRTTNTVARMTSTRPCTLLLMASGPRRRRCRGGVLRCRAARPRSAVVASLPRRGLESFCEEASRRRRRLGCGFARRFTSSLGCSSPAGALGDAVTAAVAAEDSVGERCSVGDAAGDGVTTTSSTRGVSATRASLGCGAPAERGQLPWRAAGSDGRGCSAATVAGCSGGEEGGGWSQKAQPGQCGGGAKPEGGNGDGSQAGGSSGAAPEGPSAGVCSGGRGPWLAESAETVAVSSATRRLSRASSASASASMASSWGIPPL